MVESSDGDGDNSGDENDDDNGDVGDDGTGYDNKTRTVNAIEIP